VRKPETVVLPHLGVGNLIEPAPEGIGFVGFDEVSAVAVSEKHLAVE